MTKALTPTDAAALVASLDGYVAQIVAEKEAEALATEKRGSNVETRKAALMTALVKANKKVKGGSADIAPAATAAKALPAKSKALASFVESAIETGLTEEQAVVLLDQMLDAKLVKELIDATYDAAKQAVFASMTMAATESGEEFPEHTNMVLDVPEMGKRFCREGAGRKPAVLDEAKLAELVGADVWEAITTEQTLVVRQIDEAKLTAAVADNPALLEQVREAVNPGDWKTPRLMIRDIPANEKE
jgi:hypothetical protein